MFAQIRPIIAQQVKFFKTKANIAKSINQPNNDGTELRKYLAFGGFGTIFLWYNSEFSSITGKRRLNILNDQNREIGANILFQTMVDPSFVHPINWKDYENKTNVEKFIDALMATYLQEKQVAPNHPGFERLQRIVDRLVGSNDSLEIQTPKLHLTPELMISAYSLAYHIVS